MKNVFQDNVKCCGGIICREVDATYMSNTKWSTMRQPGSKSDLTRGAGFGARISGWRAVVQGPG